MRNKNERATVGAFAAAPLVASIMAAILTYGRDTASLFTYLMLLPTAYVYSSLPVLVVGVPLYFVFKRLNAINWWSCIGSGSVIGILYGMLFQYPNPLVLHVMEMYALIGASASLGFWVIWRRGQ